MSTIKDDLKRAAEIGFDKAIEVMTMRKNIADAMKEVKDDLSSYQNEKKTK